MTIQYLVNVSTSSQNLRKDHMYSDKAYKYALDTCLYIHTYSIKRDEYLYPK